MTDNIPFEVGDHVLISRDGGPFNTFVESEEAAVVLAIGAHYDCSKGGKTTKKKDGILVKLKITNTREVFPPEKVCAQLPISPPATRNQRRSRVTPSPAIMPPEDSLSASTADSSDEVKPRTTRKRSAKSMESDKKATAAVVKKAAGTTKKTKASKYFSDTAETSFRVQASLSSTAKCQSCQEVIRKNMLKIQLTSQKRGWYHVACAMKDLPQLLDAKSVPNMQGFEALDEAEQHFLTAQLNSEDPLIEAVPPMQKQAVVEWDDDEDKDGDPPLVSLSNKKPAAKATKKKATNNRGKSKKEEEEEEEEDGVLHASDTDSDDLKDMPFRVEYATTGRATCKGCDERIKKGLIRVAEQPLFRGKPGFTVYRHLHCAIFGEEIGRLQDVGGWRRIKMKDRPAVSERIEKSEELIEKEKQELHPDELVQVAFQGEMRAPPKGLSGDLLPFQVEGVSWMVHQERNVPEIRGGILADEMGMGKTLQTITTILDNRPKLQWSPPGAKHPPAATDIDERVREEALWKKSLETWHVEMEKCNVPKHLITPRSTKKGAPVGARAGTLVVCPVIALYQWREEIKKFTEENTLSVCCYHGPNRQKEHPREMLCKYDVVLTTYQVIESDFRKMVSPNKVKCPNCGGSFKIDKLKVHLKYFCGESARRTEAQARQRRTADRPGDRGGSASGGRNGKGAGSKGNTKTELKKKSFKVATKTKAKVVKKKPPSKAASKKVVRAKKTIGFDSDSDISVDEDLDLSSPRPRRSAAASASRRMSASAKQWGETANSSSSESFADNASSGSEDSSVGFTPLPKKKARIQVKRDETSSDSDDSSDDEAVARATKKQKLALNRARVAKKNIGKKEKKSFSKGKKNVKKKFPNESSSEEDSESDNEDRDPMEGIDLDQLMQDAMKGSRESVLHTMCWWRVVLDEAHMIKSRSSQTAAAAFALTSIHRWCLSGTPLQNRVGELYSLIRFLRIDPMAHYFCRKEGCDCKSVHYRMLNGKCQDCGHGTIQHFSHFNKHVLNPIQRAGYQGDGRRAMMKLKEEVLDRALIRRTKQSRAEDMNLPPRVVTIKTVRLHPIEEDFYNALYTQTKSSFDDYVTEGTLLNNYAHIFDLLTKMRQAVDHPYLIVYSKKNAGKYNTNSPAVANGSVDCELCHEPPTDRVVSSCCGSGFCRSCVMDFMTPALENLQAGTQCPCCRQPLSVDFNQDSSDVVDDSTLIVPQGSGSATEGMPSLKELPHVSSGSILRRINLAEFTTSTKVEALIQELVEMRKHRSGSKALVFSQFVNMLDLVRWRLHSDPCLQDLGLGVRIIHGGMNVNSRDEALKDFREDNSVRVLLMSLKAGGVALNLTVANEAYLMDPWWNPAAEMQAIDRTHRLGQYRPIRAVRLIAEGTVEERVLQLQEKKRLVFDGTVGRDAASLKMLTVDDMKAMFT